MKLIDRYIGSSVLWGFLIVVFVLLGLDYTLTFIDQVKKVSADYPIQSLLQVLLYRLPGRFAEYIPISSLIGTLVGLGAMAASSELTVMRAAGVPIWRIGVSALQPILIISGVGLWISEYVAPIAEQKADLMEKLQDQQSNLFSLTGGVWVRADESYVYINAADADGILYGVQIFSPEEHALKSIQKAAKATHLENNSWQLENVVTTQFLADQVQTSTAATQEWPVSLKPKHLFLATQEPEALSLSQSLEYRQYLLEQQLNSARYELEFWTKILRPIAAITLVIVALSSVFGPLRSSTMGGRVFSGVMIGLLFQTGLNLFGKMSLAVGFSPLLGVSIPIILCLGIGLLLMRRAR